MSKRGRPATTVIDIELACRLHAEHGAWKPAVEAYNALRGTTWTMMAVYHAVWLSRGRRKYTTPTDSNQALGTFWMPAKPRPLRIVPDYRTNTTRRS